MDTKYSLDGSKVIGLLFLIAGCGLLGHILKSQEIGLCIFLLTVAYTLYIK